MAQGGIVGQIRAGWAAGSPHTWKKLEQVYDCTIPTAVSSDLDNTTFGVTDYMSSVPGMAKVSDAIITMFRDQDPVTSPNQNQLFALRAAKTLVYWRIEVAAGNDLSVCLWEAYEFGGRVKSFVPTGKINALQTCQTAVSFDKIYGFVQYGPMASLLGAG